VEREIAGFRAAGRNGGWCCSKFPLTPAMLETCYGRNAARAQMLAMNGSVEEVARICDDERIDAQFHKGGVLTLPRAPHHLPMPRSAFDGYSKLGLSQYYRLCSISEAQERVKVTGTCGALYASENANIHPSRLVRGVGARCRKTRWSNLRAHRSLRVSRGSLSTSTRLASRLISTSHVTHFRSEPRAMKILPTLSIIGLPSCPP
jgi:glycine/D-amino acid oxidase-like deaminating enzyme